MPVPRFIKVLFATDIAFGVIYLGYFLIGHPYAPLAKLIDLDGEANLPTWYSSMQWFCVAYVLWVFAIRHIVRSQIRSWFLTIVPIVFLLFSIDEVATLHEHLGVLSDALLPNGTRGDTPFIHTGLYFVFIGIPFIILFVGLIAAVRPYLTRYPAGFLKIAVGFALFMFAAGGLDFLSNFVEIGSFASAIQILTEEVTEMIAATIVLWGSYQLIAGATPFIDGVA